MPRGIVLSSGFSYTSISLFSSFPFLISLQTIAMSSYSLLNTEPERWKKIVKAADSGHYPNIMIDDGELVTTPKAGDAVNIQSFLADVFKDGDSEWFKTEFDTLEAGDGEAANEGQPESSKKKKISLTKQRTLARQEKKDRELGTSRVSLPKGNYSPAEWNTITTAAKDLDDGGTEARKALDLSGVNLEGGTVFATGHSIIEAHSKLSRFVTFALDHDLP